MEKQDVRQALATINFQARTVERFELIDFGETTLLIFAPTETTPQITITLENCVGFSMSYGLNQPVTSVKMIDLNPMLGNLYCTIMFNNDRTARIMCKNIRID